jgi:Mce-associated membrane protein
VARTDSAAGRATTTEPNTETKAGTETETERMASPVASRSRIRRLGDPPLGAMIILAVLATGCAGWFGWSWYDASHDDSLAYSRTRDDVLRAGEQAIQNLNTLDYRNVDQGLALWAGSTTGDLHQQIEQGRAQFEQQVRAAKTRSTARVLDGAVTELDDRTGKASVIVAVQITVTPATGRPTTKLSRLKGQLTRTPSGWQLSALGQAATGVEAAGTTPPPGR